MGNTDVFIVCYSIISPTSLENVGNKWLPEIRHHCPEAPFLLVGTKSDLRKDSGSFVDPARAKNTGKELRAVRVMECSAKDHVGLKDVFEEAIRAALADRRGCKKKKRKDCTLL